MYHEALILEACRRNKDTIIFGTQRLFEIASGPQSLKIAAISLSIVKSKFHPTNAYTILQATRYLRLSPSPDHLHYEMAGLQLVDGNRSQSQ